jgi:hypothetical protein
MGLGLEPLIFRLIIEPAMISSIKVTDSLIAEPVPLLISVTCLVCLRWLTFHFFYSGSGTVSVALWMGGD